LLALTQAGVSREDAYRIVQRNAMPVRLEGRDFREQLEADSDVSLTKEQLDACFDPAYHTSQVNTIFERVFGSATP